VVVPWWCRVGDELRSCSKASSAGGQPEKPGAVHLFAATRRHGVVRPQPGGLNQSGGHADVRGPGNSRARNGLRPFRFSLRLGQATDLAVTQAVVDEDEKFAGGRHPSDLLAPALAHPVVVGPDRRVGALAGHRLDGRPAHETRALLGDMAPADLLVGLAVRRSEPGPAAQVSGRREPRDVADLGHEDRGEDRTASYNGTAPIEFSSGGRIVHRVSTRGSRKLNHAIHMAAVTQIRNSGTPGRIYFERKVAEGKTKKEALRSLKRQTSNAVYRQLIFDAQ